MTTALDPAWPAPPPRLVDQRAPYYRDNKLIAHAKILINFFNSDRGNSTTDVDVFCDGKFVRSAHRAVLAAFSSHFEELLRDQQRSTVDIDPNFVSFDELNELIKYVYTGLCKLSGDTMNAASRLGYSGTNLGGASHEFGDQWMFHDPYPGLTLFAKLKNQLKAEKIFLDCKYEDPSPDAKPEHRYVGLHRIMLNAYCENTPTDPDELTQFLKKLNISRFNFNHIIDFVYNGCLFETIPGDDLKSDELSSLRDAAAELGLKRLVEAIDKGMAMAEGGDGCDLPDMDDVEVAEKSREGREKEVNLAREFADQFYAVVKKEREFERKIDEYEKEKDELKNENELMKTLLKEKDDELVKNVVKCAEVEKRIVELKKEKDELKKEKDELNKENERLKKKSNEAEKEELMSLAVFDNLIHDDQRDAATIVDQINSKIESEKNEELMRKCEEVKKENVQLRLEIGELEEDKKRLSDIVSNTNEEVNSLKAEKTDLEGFIVKLNEQLLSEKAEKEELARKCAECKCPVEELYEDEVEEQPSGNNDEQVASDDSGKDLVSVVNLQTEMKNDYSAHNGRIGGIRQTASQFKQKAPHQRYQALGNRLDLRMRPLGESLQDNVFFDDNEDEWPWGREKEQVAASTYRGRDRIGVQNVRKQRQGEYDDIEGGEGEGGEERQEMLYVEVDDGPRDYDLSDGSAHSVQYPSRGKVRRNQGASGSKRNFPSGLKHSPERRVKRGRNADESDSVRMGEEEDDLDLFEDEDLVQKEEEEEVTVEVEVRVGVVETKKFITGVYSIWSGYEFGRNKAIKAKTRIYSANGNQPPPADSPQDVLKDFSDPLVAGPPSSGRARSTYWKPRGLKPIKDAEGYWLCPHPGCTHKSKNNLVTHHRTHTGAKSHYCKICGKGVTTIEYVREHLWRDHFKMERKKCDRCKKNFYVDYQYFGHHCKPPGGVQRGGRGGRGRGRGGGRAGGTAGRKSENKYAEFEDDEEEEEMVVEEEVMEEQEPRGRGRAGEAVVEAKDDEDEEYYAVDEAEYEDEEEGEEGELE